MRAATWRVSALREIRRCLPKTQSVSGVIPLARNVLDIALAARSSIRLKLLEENLSCSLCSFSLSLCLSLVDVFVVDDSFSGFGFLRKRAIGADGDLTMHRLTRHARIIHGTFRSITARYCVTRGGLLRVLSRLINSVSVSEGEGRSGFGTERIGKACMANSGLPAQVVTSEFALAITRPFIRRRIGRNGGEAAAKTARSRGESRTASLRRLIHYVACFN